MRREEEAEGAVVGDAADEDEEESVVDADVASD